jgi:hypothetical protein
MNSNFIVSGSVVRVADSSNLKVFPVLPNNTYEVKFNKETGEFFLEQVDSLVNPTQLYGNIISRARRVIATFNHRNRNTGVLLTGMKGSGKSALMRQISIESGLPVLLVNSPFHGPVFAGFLAGITQPCVILMDEFDKVYSDEEAQGGILTILDGMYNSNKLFVASLNKIEKVVDAMRNRPGRFFYHYDYDTISREDLLAYLEATLHTDAPALSRKRAIDSVVAVYDKFDSMNFDMLKAIVEEMNRYNELADEVLQHLNVAPEDSDAFNYVFTATREGWTCVEQWGSSGNPLARKEFTRTFVFNRNGEDVPDLDDSDAAIGKYNPNREKVVVYLSQDNLVSFDSDKGIFTFKSQGITVSMSRISKYL